MSEKYPPRSRNTLALVTVAAGLAVGLVASCSASKQDTRPAPTTSIVEPHYPMFEARVVSLKQRYAEVKSMYEQVGEVGGFNNPTAADALHFENGTLKIFWTDQTDTNTALSIFCQKQNLVVRWSDSRDETLGELDSAGNPVVLDNDQDWVQRQSTYCATGLLPASAATELLEDPKIRYKQSVQTM